MITTVLNGLRSTTRIKGSDQITLKTDSYLYLVRKGEEILIFKDPPKNIPVGDIMIWDPSTVLIFKGENEK